MENLQLKNITEIKNLQNGLSNRMEIIEGSVSKDRSIEIIQFEKDRKN